MYGTCAEPVFQLQYSKINLENYAVRGASVGPQNAAMLMSGKLCLSAPRASSMRARVHSCYE